MVDFEFSQFKAKFLDMSPGRYWGDDFDVRYYLIMQLKSIFEKRILDIGGQSGMVSFELNSNNYRVNIDSSFSDLQNCLRINSEINCICASMTNLPFKKDAFDVILCSHILEVGKIIDLQSSDNKINTQYPTVQKILSECNDILVNKGKLYITTCNNLYYKSVKLDYNELKNALSQYFSKYTLWFFNTYPKLGKNRKLNFANTIPKLLLKIKSHKKILNSLIKKDTGINKSSVSFYVEVEK